MQREILNPKSEEEWLQWRKSDITSTMASALFDMSPYQTKFELYHAKSSGVELDFESNDRMEKGKRMEQFAAEEVCLEHGFTDLRRIDEYIRIPELRIGSSFDYECVCPKRGLGLLEMKAVDYQQYKEKWQVDEAPAHIEVQANHQMMVAGDKYKWSAIAAFYSLYDHCLLIREPDPEFNDAIIAAVKEFWDDVDNENEPSADYSRDLDIIKALYEINDDYKDYTENEQIELLSSKFLRLKSEEKSIKKEVSAVQAELFDTLDNCKGGYTDAHKISVVRVKDTPATIITKEMVGEKTGGRKGYLRLNIKTN